MCPFKIKKGKTLQALQLASDNWRERCKFQFCLMELRSCTHLHFIEAIKGGSEVKTLNVFRGKPVLNFKTVIDVYGTDDTKNNVPVSVDGPKVEFDDSQINCDRTRADRTCMLAGESILIKSELDISGSNCRNDDESREGESDDSGALTLRQIKERRNKKKRKHSRYIGEEVIASCSPEKLEHHHSVSEEDECDLMVPLISLKSRISESRTTKRKCRKGSASNFTNGLSTLKEENASNQVIIQPAGDYFMPPDVKVEVLEPIHSDCRSMTFMAVDSSLCCDEPVASSGEISTERLDEANDCISGSGTPVVFSEEPETVKDIVWESGTSTIPTSEPERAQNFVLEAQMPKIFEEETAALEDHLKNKLPTISYEEPNPAESHLSEDRMSRVSCEEPETAEDHLMENGMPTVSCKEPTSPRDHGKETQMATILQPQCCVLSEQSYEYVEHPDPKSILSAKASDGEMTVNVAKITSHQFSCLTLSKLENGDSVIDSCPNIDSSEASSPSEYCNSHMEVDSQRLPGEHEASQETNDNSQVQEPHTTIHDSLVEFSSRQDSCLTEDEAKDDKPHFMTDGTSIPTSNCSLFVDSNLSSTPNDNLISVPDDSLTTEEAQSDAAGNCNQVIHSRVDEPVAFADTENLHVKHPPERLLSTRKIISPNTQKRLCKAMETNELDDEQYYKHTRKLCYMNVKQTEDSTGRFERPNHIKKAEVATSPETVIMSQNYKNGFCNKSILKVPHLSRGVARVATRSASCPESVISFSQQQMRDIEIVASKLTKELNSMKSIVEETLQSTSSPTTSFKYSADEMRVAIQSATKVEESARKWVSIMGRDCNRFCKIMKSTEKGSSTTRTAPCKEKRKIVFADEAGGKLCDVKTFDTDVALSSLMEFVTSNTEIVD